MSVSVMPASQTTPRDGRAFVGLLVGGYDKLIERLKPEIYEEYGVLLRHHWTEQRFMNVIPRDVEVICILTDHCSHGMSREAVRLAKVHGCRFVLMGRKKSAWLSGFRLSGFVQKPSWLKPLGPKVEIKMTPTNGPMTGKPNGFTPPTAPAVPAVKVPAARPPEFPPVAAPAPVAAPTPANVGIPRIVKLTAPWTERDLDALMQELAAVKEGTTATQFLAGLYGRTGVYRTARVMTEHLRSLAPLLSPPHWLVLAMSRQGAEDQKTKHRARDAERVALATTARRDWPDYISTVAADALVGGVRHRLTRTGIKVSYDTQRCMFVYPTAEVLAVVEDRESRGLTPTPERHHHARNQEEWQARIIERLKAGGPRTANQLGVVGKPIAEAALKQVVSTGQVLERPSRFRQTLMVYGVPGQFPAPPAPASTRARVTVGAAFQARMEIIRDMREGRITAAEAASLLAEMTR